MISSSNYEPDGLRTEVAILQKKILAFKPCYAKLKIPALMGSDIDDEVIVPMPLHISMTYGDKTIPKGTKFVVYSVSGNYNDIKVLGYYDKPKSINIMEYYKKFIDSKTTVKTTTDSNGNTVTTTTVKEPESALPSDYRTFGYDEV